MHVAVQPEPVPVAPPGHERVEHPPSHLGRIRARSAGKRSSSRVAEHVVDPGELAGDLAGAEVEARVGQVGQDRAVAPANVSSCAGQHQRALLAQRTIPSATSSIHRSAPLATAISTARVSRS